MFDNVTIAPAASSEYQGAAKTSTGFSFNIIVTCPLVCIGTLEVLTSVDGVNYEVIPQLTNAINGTTPYYYNVFNFKGLYFKVRATNIGVNDIIIYGYQASKSGV